MDNKSKTTIKYSKNGLTIELLNATSHDLINDGYVS